MASKLRAKVAKFQKQDGLKVTGKFDSVTRAEIKRARKGKPSQTVKARTARRKARTTAAANDPAAVTAPLTAGTLKNEVDAAVRQKFGSTEQGLNDQARVSQFQTDRRIPDYYADYLKAIQNAQYSSAGAYDQAGQQVQGQIAGDTASSGSAEAQQAAASRKTLLQSQANSTAAQKASSQTYFGGLQANSVLAKAQATDRESNRKDSILKQLAQTKQDEGDYATTLTRDARTSERNYDLQRETLGLNTAKAASDVTTKTLTAKLNAQAKKAANDLARDSLGERTRHDQTNESIAQQRADQAGKPKKPTKKGLSEGAKKAIHAGRSDISRARALYEGVFKKNYKAYYNAGIGAKKPLSSAVLHAGYELSKQGYIGPHTTKELKAIGITVPSSWRRKPSAAATSVRTVSGIATAVGGVRIPK